MIVYCLYSRNVFKSNDLEKTGSAQVENESNLEPNNNIVDDGH